MKLEIPIVAIVDSNNSMHGISYPIPANDDAISSIALYTRLAADAVIEGIEKAQQAAREEEITTSPSEADVVESDEASISD